MPVVAFDHNKTTAKDRYDALEGEKKAYQDRAEKCAKYTIPMAFPKATSTYSTEYDTPYQSIGARGVNNLASKLLTALVPPNAPFFRLGLGSDVMKQMQQNPDVLMQWEQALSQYENNIVQYMESTLQLRTTASEAFIQLLIAGNCLLFLPPAEGGIKMYRLKDYCVLRDGIGNIVEIVAVDHIAAAALPPEAQSLIKDDVEPSKKIDVYTHVYLEGDNFLSYQEIDGQQIGSSNQSYPVNKTPWMALRLRKMDGESYGRSFVDEYIGDLSSLELLSKAIVEASGIAANILYMVNPNSTTKISELSKAKSGDFIKGKIEDVQILQMNKAADLQIAQMEKQQLSSDLSYAFLLNSAVQRNAERVTAEEIRYVAQELEGTIGSIYSILSQEFQLPLVRRCLVQMERLGLIPELPQGAKGIEPVVTTGIEALGRGADLQNLDTFIRYAQIFPEAFNTAVKANQILSQICTALRINPAKVIKTDAEVQQEQAMAAQQQAAASGMETAANAAGQQMGQQQ